MTHSASLQAHVQDQFAEGLRQTLARQPEAESLLTWLRLASGELTLDGYYEMLSSRDALTYLTLDTTGACDLQCPGMCYYHPEIQNTMPQVSLEKLQDAIGDAHGLGMKALVVGGKEPFLNATRLFEILTYAGAIKGNDFAVGLITNGRNVQRYWDRLSESVTAGNVDFMDVSIDSGYPEQHDAIRGVRGTFELASATVRRLSREFPDVRTGISSVLRRDNQAGLLELLRRMAPETRNFCFQPIQPPPFSTTLPVSGPDVISFLANVDTLLATELSEAAVEVMFILHGPYVSDLASAGLFEWTELGENREGQIFAGHKVGGNTVLYNLMVLPDYGWKQARINYRGDYLAHAHFLQTPDPSQHAVGNIQQERLLPLLRKAKQRGRLAHKLLEARRHHECRGRRCWTTCFGGWTISENDFLKGRSLSAQPSACLKTPSDF